MSLTSFDYFVPADLNNHSDMSFRWAAFFAFVDVDTTLEGMDETSVYGPDDVKDGSLDASIYIKALKVWQTAHANIFGDEYPIRHPNGSGELCDWESLETYENCLVQASDWVTDALTCCLKTLIRYRIPALSGDEEFLARAVAILMHRLREGHLPGDRYKKINPFAFIGNLTPYVFRDVRGGGAVAQILNPFWRPHEGVGHTLSWQIGHAASASSQGWEIFDENWHGAGVPPYGHLGTFLNPDGPFYVDEQWVLDDYGEKFDERLKPSKSFAEIFSNQSNIWAFRDISGLGFNTNLTSSGQRPFPDKVSVGTTFKSIGQEYTTDLGVYYNVWSYSSFAVQYVSLVRTYSAHLEQTIGECLGMQTVRTEHLGGVGVEWAVVDADGYHVKSSLQACLEHTFTGSAFVSAWFMPEKASGPAALTTEACVAYRDAETLLCLRNGNENDRVEITDEDFPDGRGLTVGNERIVYESIPSVFATGASFAIQQALNEQQQLRSSRITTATSIVCRGVNDMSASVYSRGLYKVLTRNHELDDAAGNNGNSYALDFDWVTADYTFSPLQNNWADISGYALREFIDAGVNSSFGLNWFLHYDEDTGKTYNEVQVIPQELTFGATDGSDEHIGCIGLVARFRDTDELALYVGFPEVFYCDGKPRKLTFPGSNEGGLFVFEVGREIDLIADY